MKKNVLVLAGLMAIANWASAAAPNLVVNGSFESTVQKNHTWGTYTSLPGWTGLPTIEVRNNVAGRAQDGKNFVELDTNRNSGMSQSIFASGLVELSFWYSARPKTGATNDIQVKFGDSFEAVVLHGVSNSTSSNIWQKFTQVINLGNSPSSVLSFYARGKSDSYGGSLDNISVTAVPEPETFAMLLAGLGLVGAAVRRRKGLQAPLVG